MHYDMLTLKGKLSITTVHLLCYLCTIVGPRTYIVCLQLNVPLNDLNYIQNFQNFTLQFFDNIQTNYKLSLQIASSFQTLQSWRSIFHITILSLKSIRVTKYCHIFHLYRHRIIRKPHALSMKYG